MKKWIQKFIDQLESGSKTTVPSAEIQPELTEERGTLLYILDVLSKNVIETDSAPTRKVRETLDSIAKELVAAGDLQLEKTLFRLRQYVASQRIDESTYVQKSFDEFRHIIWDLIENLSHDMVVEKSEESGLEHSLLELREAVEANSVEDLKSHSRKFIQSYLQVQQAKDLRRTKRAESVKKNLSTVKKQLIDAQNSARTDHLTRAYNRKTFDENMAQQWNLFQLTKQPMCLILLDIDHFKKVNDTFGHAMGDSVLIELVKMLKELYPRDADQIARIGGEEFAIILPDYQLTHAMRKAEETLSRVRAETLVDKDMRVKFTVSLGVAAAVEGETKEQWLQRADAALYSSKNAGRDRYTVAPNLIGASRVA